ncbi:MAG: hypothetical protein P8Y44_12070 [Acidobacteriota bacterium]
MKRNFTANVLGLLASALIASPVVLAIEHPMIGNEAPAFELQSLEGDIVSSADLAGDHVVLHFGAGW